MATTSDKAGNPADLGVRVRRLRKQKDWTLEELAGRAGLTKSFASKIERGVAQASLSTALRLADALGLSIGQLLGDGSDADAVSVDKAGERVPFRRDGARASYIYEAMATRRADKRMQPVLMRPPPVADGATQLYEHRGEEFIFVTKGRIELTVGTTKKVLDTGDSAYFDASLPHASYALDEGAEAVVVLATGD